MQIDVARWLTGSITRHPVQSLSSTAEPVYGPPHTVACLIFPTERYALDDDGHQVLIDYDVVHLGSTPLEPRDQVTDGVAVDGTVVLVRGIIVSVDDSFHPVDERKMRVAGVKNAVPH